MKAIAQPDRLPKVAMGIAWPLPIARLLRSPVGLSGIIVAGYILLGAAAWSAMLTYVEFDRRETIAAGIKQNSNLAIAFEEHTARTIKGIDAAAVFLRHERARKGATLNISKYIRERVIDGQLFTLVAC